MKVIVDMNLSPRWIEILRLSGIEAEHWSSIGRATAPDFEILAYAAANGAVVLTHDLDFGAILAATHSDRPSVVQIRGEDVSPDVVGRAVIAALLQMKVELQAGALLTVDPKRTRLSILPIGREV